MEMENDIKKKDFPRNVDFNGLFYLIFYLEILKNVPSSKTSFHACSHFTFSKHITQQE